MRKAKVGAAILVGMGAAYAARQALRLSRRISLRDKGVVIVGGSRGLGLAIAREAARHGARLFLVARHQDELERAARDVRSLGAQAHTYVCDAADRGQIAGMIGEAERRLGGIDVLINNAAIITVGPLETMTREDFERSMAIIFFAPLHAMLEAIGGMKARGGGRIVNIASVGGKMVVPHLVPYCAAKFALVGLSEGMRTELVKENIYVSTVNPNLMNTGSPRHAIFKGQNKKEYAWFAIGDAIPGLASGARGAAKAVLSAAIHGDAEVTFGLPARLGAKLYGMCPNTQIELATLAGAFLPAAGGIGSASARGKESESALTRSPLRAWGRRAERQLNQRNG